MLIICSDRGFSASSSQLRLGILLDAAAAQLLTALCVAAFPASPAPFQLSFILDLYALARGGQRSTP